MFQLRLRQLTLYLIISLSVGFLAPALAQARETYLQFAGRMMSEGAFRPDIEKALFLKVNAYRAAKGRVQLGLDQSMQFAARAHAQDMAEHNFVGHVASTGHDFESRMRAFRGGGMLLLPSLGENAADTKVLDSPDAIAEVLFQEWLHSEEHRRAMVSNDYVKAAIGVSVLNGKAYADQIFVGSPPHDADGIFGGLQQQQ